MRRLWLTSIPLVLVCSAGCSWKTFDELEDDLWVDVTTGPSSPNTTFATALAVPSTRTGDPAARIAVLGNNRPTLTYLSFAADGKRTETKAVSLGESVSIETFSLNPAFTADRGSSLIGFAALTHNEDMQLAVYDLDKANGPINATTLAKPQTLPGETPPAQYAPEGLAFGHLNDPLPTGPIDAVVGRELDAVLVVDARSSTASVYSCLHGGKWAYAVAVADVLSTNPGPEVIISTGSQQRNAMGSAVRLFSVATLKAHLGVNNAAPACAELAPTELRKPDLNDYGEELLVADFGGDGTTEILASAPQSNRIFVIAEGADHKMAEAALIGEGNDFGDAMAAGDLDGDGKPELVVGAPRANVGSTSNAGVVYVYKWDAAAKKFSETPIATFHDAEPETEQGFGSTVAIMPWGIGARSVLVVGARGELFTYFRTKDLYDEVRTER